MTEVGVGLATVCLMLALAALRDAIVLTIQRRSSWRRWLDFGVGVCIAVWVWAEATGRM